MSLIQALKKKTVWKVTRLQSKIVFETKGYKILSKGKGYRITRKEGLQKSF